MTSPAPPRGSLRRPAPTQPLRLAVLVGLALVASSTRIHGSGLSVLGQGARAIALGGAFVAQADDPSAVFYNAGGLAFFRASEVAAGAEFLRTDEVAFRGPGSTESGDASGRQAAATVFPPHVYAVQPLGNDMAAGLGVYVPYGTLSEWRDRDRWAGRFLGESLTLQTLDLTLGIGWRPAPRLGLGVGLFSRFSQFSFRRALQGTAPDERLLEAESSFRAGFGWSLGILHKPNDRLSWGASYRSSVELSYSGDAKITDNASGTQIGSSLPFRTRIEYPPELRLGVALAVTPTLTTEVGLDWTDWRSLERVEIAAGPGLTTTLFEDWAASRAYRVGLRIGGRLAGEWCAGYVWEESPQPDSDVGPVLVDSDIQIITVGYAATRERYAAQIALGYRLPEDRTVRNHRDGFNGTYRKDASWFLALTQQF